MQAQSHERAEYLAALHIEHTKDEFGQDRFFVADIHEDWVEGPFDTRDLAQGEIDAMRKEG